MRQHQAKRKDNPSQMEVLRSASKMRGNIVAIAAPPGTGKSRTFRDKAIALAKIGHKLLCVASANVVVDTDVTAVWQSLSSEKRKQYKCLRLEGNGAEQAAILSKINYTTYNSKEGEEDQLPTYIDPAVAENSPLMRTALEKIASEYAARHSQMAALMEQYDTLEKVYRALTAGPRMKRSNVIVGMALDYRIWEMTENEKVKALHLALHSLLHQVPRAPRFPTS
ncbi:hypothetical protein IMSHALPRED_005783 [Imshaugia aleurites]|uniref:DNA2/NAM7 helicase helicase domain-containing protein n=1 Tax=Imshaugia aleurites TaxID=172621 RepID=A0A8H3IR35_9LECA|nr:hypothetical protein IMSHALPRED_005783 [Imshaugia aleurites]